MLSRRRTFPDIARAPVGDPGRYAWNGSRAPLENPTKRDFFRMKAASNLEWLSCQRTTTETVTVYNEAWGREPAKHRERSATVAG
jgi:hypothetical protein